MRGRRVGGASAHPVCRDDIVSDEAQVCFVSGSVYRLPHWDVTKKPEGGVDNIMCDAHSQCWYPSPLTIRRCGIELADSTMSVSLSHPRDGDVSLGEQETRAQLVHERSLYG